MKKIGLVVGAMLLLVLAACGSDIEDVTIMTGGEQGTYFPLGAALANNIINEHVDGVNAESVTSGASVVNINGLVDGDAQMALVQNDIAYYASEGINMFEEEGPLSGFHGIATLYPEVIQIITSADSGIETVEDLAGKRVAVGDLGSGAEANAKQILEIHGITYEDISEEYMDFGTAAGNIQDGNVDAAFITAGLPTGAVEALRATKELRLVEISSDKLGELAAAYPYYTEFVVESSVYGTDGDVTTAAVLAMLVVDEDLEEDLVYDITKAMFEHVDQFSNAHQQGTNITLDSALDGMPITIHPGAQRYFDEQ
ncbi:TAXI family TRAP transporter solute-binding subunit [Halalkalibacter hemicellulosilyticus]|uniref:TAXI family TRAP transporter solute-binding subunit n=1 Tax=Halalkalibacter hemicellulosilyticus TaxID=127886 RepID=UPI00054DD53A|nr:TAXI family TRAP transporter solute-binding subunit [Halalkalibacter hemicellulosilyticus]